MIYTIVIIKQEGSDYGVIVPDLPGCFSAGKTIAETIRNATKAINLHVEGLRADGEPVPAPNFIMTTDVEIKGNK